MATATLTFDLNDTDDRQEHLRCVKSLDMALVIWDIVYEVKKRTERQLENSETSTDAEFQLHEKIFEEIHDTLNERGIKIDELIT
jgi:hypothetical protein